MAKQKVWHPQLNRYVEVDVPAGQTTTAPTTPTTPQTTGTSDTSAMQKEFQAAWLAAPDMKSKGLISDEFFAATGYKLFGKPTEKTDAATQKDIDREAKKQSAAQIINQLEDMYFASQDLSYGRLGGIGEKIKAMFGFNEPLKSYESIISSIRPTLARAAGDVGALSEPEQIAAVKPLPKSNSTAQEAITGFSAMRKRFGLELRDYNNMLDEQTKSQLDDTFWKSLDDRLNRTPTLDDIYKQRKGKL